MAHHTEQRQKDMAEAKSAWLSNGVKSSIGAGLAGLALHVALQRYCTWFPLLSLNTQQSPHLAHTMIRN